MATAARKLTLTEARVAAVAATPANRELVARLFPATPGDELPGAPWFKLGAYRAVHEWADVDWFAAICARWAFLALLEAPQSPGGALPITRVAPFLKGLAVEPIAGGQSERLAPNHECELVRVGARAAPVAETRFDELPQSALEHAYEMRDQPLLRIKLEAGDIELLAAFKAWLKSRRPKAQRSAMTEADMAGWRACQVIPYLDIRLFELASGSKIRGVDIQRALFPGGADPKKTLEQSTRTHANRLMSTRFYGRLHAQFGGRP